MNGWTFYRHRVTPEGEDESTRVVWQETALGYEMQITRGHETSHYSFSTEEQLAKAVQKWKASMLSEGFSPFLRDTPETES